LDLKEVNMTTQTDQEIDRLTGYIRGLITGVRPRLDAIDTRAMEALRRRPFAEFLADLDEDGLQLRGARSNRVADILDLFATIKAQLELSTVELSRRSGVSRGHIQELLTRRRADVRPSLETIVRLAVGLEYPLFIVAQGKPSDDADVTPPRPSSAPTSTTIDPARPPPERTYRDGLLSGGFLGTLGAIVVCTFVNLLRTGSKDGAR
jgi:transcriptional regulator with XRE-family HTH domain